MLRSSIVSFVISTLFLRSAASPMARRDLPKVKMNLSFATRKNGSGSMNIADADRARAMALMSRASKTYTQQDNSSSIMDFNDFVNGKALKIYMSFMVIYLLGYLHRPSRRRKPCH
jgi:hypothetical protein